MGQLHYKLELLTKSEGGIFMRKVGIVTDSTADLPKEYIEKYNIQVVPLKVLFGDEEFLDNVNLKPVEFYKKLTTSKFFPRTSQPSPSDFIDIYKKLGEETETIISIHLSSKLSGTYQSALIAKSNLEDLDIHVIDSKVPSMVLGMIVLEAARACEQGKDKEEILKLINYLINKIKVYFVVDTLEYLQKGGRIGKASAFLGNLLSVKPILSIGDGEVIPVEKIRGRSNAFKKMIELMKEDVSPGSPIKISVFDADSEKEAYKLIEMVKSEFNVTEVIKSTIGTVIGTYVGPGTVAITFYEE